MIRATCTEIHMDNNKAYDGYKVRRCPKFLLTLESGIANCVSRAYMRHRRCMHSLQAKTRHGIDPGLGGEKGPECVTHMRTARRLSHIHLLLFIIVTV